MNRSARAAACAAACAGFLLGALTCLSPGADAKSSYESPYGYDRTWNAALRLVRVDNGWKLTEKDEASGYLLFDYKSPEASKPSSGSLEVVRGKDGSSPVTVLVQLAQMPHYHEQVLLDALVAKMRREYGDPPVPRRAPPTDSPDGGEDGE
jgi:hypothetical protein